MPSANNNKLLKKLLLISEAIGEHYWVILTVGLALFCGAAAYGYILKNDTFLTIGLYGAVIFVLAPPALLMASYLISRLFDQLRTK